MDTAKQLLSTTEAAKVLGGSRAWLYKLTKRGEGPRVRLLGGRQRYLRTELEAWMHALPVQNAGQHPGGLKR